VFLPIAPGWAQKPTEEAHSVELVVALNDDDEAAPEKDAKSEVRVVVSANGDETKVQAESVDKAAALIKDKIKVLASQAGSPETKAAQIKALKEALGALEKANSNKYIVRLNDPLRAAGQADRTSDAPSAKLSDEKKAQIDKAKSRINVLRKELEEKRQQLTNAQRDLEKLSNDLRIQLRLKAIEKDVVVPPSAARKEIRIVERKELAPKPTDKPGAATTFSGIDKERLNSLEKQLARLLDEVAKLKRQEQRPK
jgi:hypothetical protein